MNITLDDGPEWPTCTWEWDDGTRCGRPADAFRVQWLPETRRWYFCKLHIRTLRRLTADEEAWRLYQTATYAVSA